MSNSTKILIVVVVVLIVVFVVSLVVGATGATNNTDTSGLLGGAQIPAPALKFADLSDSGCLNTGTQRIEVGIVGCTITVHLTSSPLNSLTLKLESGSSVDIQVVSHPVNETDLTSKVGLPPTPNPSATPSGDPTPTPDPHPTVTLTIFSPICKPLLDQCSDAMNIAHLTITGSGSVLSVVQN